MPENKPFTEQEDRTIKFLFEELKIKQWAMVAKIMTQDYQMPRNAKQCRDRYQQFLDPLMQAEWTDEQERLLFYLHDQIGNKWALISTYFTGKTDNCVKNHFFSKLRKSVRFINRIIRTHLKKQFRQIKIGAIYKIIQAFQEQFKEKPIVEKETSKYCGGLKDALLSYSTDQEIDQMGGFGKQKVLLEKINDFSRNYRKKSKKQKKEALKGVQLFKPIQKISQVEEQQSSDFSPVNEGEELSESDQKQMKGEKEQKNEQSELRKSPKVYVLVEDEELRGSNMSRIEIKEDMLGSSGKMLSSDALKFPDFLHNSGSLDKVNYPFTFVRNQSSFKSYRSERSLVQNQSNKIDLLNNQNIRLSDTLNVVGEGNMDEQICEQDIFRSQKEPIIKNRDFC